MKPAERQERLWTPWRMRYISGHAKEDGCIFCLRVRGTDDVDSLILHRGEHSFVIMNLFPYNTGHVMIVPNFHADDPSQLDAPTLHEMADLLPTVTRALKRVLNCDGFNVGLNIGSVAGAGIAEHLHQHVVPRWLGDANFMPILASTMVIPEVIPSTYAKVRAELQREIRGDSTVRMVVLFDNDRQLALADGQLPSVTAASDQSLWRTAFGTLSDWASEIDVVGWAGANRAGTKLPGDSGSGLVIRAERIGGRQLPTSFKLVARDDARIASLSDRDQALIRNGFDHLAPAVSPPDEIDGAPD